MRWLVGLLLLSLSVSAFAATDLQYRLSNGDVMLARDATIEPVAGYGVVTISGPASAIVWPVPSGCLAGTGRSEYTRITNPGAVTTAGAGMAVRTGMVFFHTTSTLLTGCYATPSWAALKALVRDTLHSALPDRDVIEGLNPHWTWYYALCKDALTNQSCIDWKTNLDVMDNMYPGRGQGVTVSTQGAILVTDALAFKAAQGW
jgi:hypothetical protein